MSDPAAGGFLPALRDVEARLSAPLPDRVRIVRELAADLEALRDGFMARGVPEPEASRRALEAVLPGPDALRALERVHAPRYRRLVARLDPERLHRIERRTLAVATAGVVVAQTGALVRLDLLADPSPFLWPVLASGAVLFAVVAATVFRLWIEGDHREPDRGLGTILALAGVTLAVGGGGAVIDLYHLAAALEAEPHRAGPMVLRWVVRDGVLLSVALLLALAGGLAWLLITQWLGLVSGARRRVLGLDGTVSLSSECDPWTTSGSPSASSAGR